MTGDTRRDRAREATRALAIAALSMTVVWGPVFIGLALTGRLT